MRESSPTQPTKFPRAGWKASITKSRRYGGRATDIPMMTIFSSSSLMLQEKFISEIRNHTKFRIEPKIIKESLFYAPNGRMGAIFTRDGNKVKVAEKFSRIETLCKEKLTANKLVLSLSVNNLNYEELEGAFLFYKNGLVILMNDNNNWLEYSASKFEHDKAIKEMFLKFMKDTLYEARQVMPRLSVPPITLKCST